MRLRVQIVQPCMAKCRWCGTFKKNNFFSSLVENGVSEKVHYEYKKLIKHFKPDSLYISGGEPLLYEKIDQFLRDVSSSVKDKIFIFTSFQYPEKVINNMPLERIPFEKVVLTHTTAGFEENKWKQMTDFDFEKYIENINYLSSYPWEKRIKFIANNENVRKEIDFFKERIKTDKSFNFNLKLINEQSGSNSLSKINKASDSFINELKNNLKRKFKDVDQEMTGIGIIKSLNGEINNIKCGFRENKEEIRFAFYTSNKNGIKLKYRFCPFFPLEKHFKYKLGRDSYKTVEKSFNGFKWHKWCSKCRLKHYL